MMLRQIQHFQTIVQENSFTEAAELCHISQSGISQSIKALEDEIGAKLLICKNRKDAEVLTGLAVCGSDCQNDKAGVKSEVDEWISSLGLS